MFDSIAFLVQMIPLTIWFWVPWVWRYGRLIVHCFAHWTYKSIPIPAKPSFTSLDVTVIIPTISTDFEELRDSLLSILACNPLEILLVTTSDKYSKLKSFKKTFESTNIRVFESPIANKRLQVCVAIPEVKTPITIMADDDVTWPNTMLPWLLAPFEDAKMGGVGSCQRVKRICDGSVASRSWNWLGVAYIERRNFEISATHAIDGGTSCMSGRTCAFRSVILKESAFQVGFKNEHWGKYQLNADDDNFVTRWLVSHQWKTWIQYNKECELETTLENNSMFLKQCLRWARSNWRSNWTSLVHEKHVWTQQPWCTYALHLTTFSSLSILFDPYILIIATMLYGRIGFIMQFIWMFGFVKTVKLVGLFRRNPSDLIYYPLSVIFGLLHGFIKIYALLTWNVTSWGSREDGDSNDNHRMSPRINRSASVTLPAGEQHSPILIRYRGEKASVFSEKIMELYSDHSSESDSEDQSDSGDSRNSTTPSTPSASAILSPKMTDGR